MRASSWWPSLPVLTNCFFCPQLSAVCPRLWVCPAWHAEAFPGLKAALGSSGLCCAQATCWPSFQSLQLCQALARAQWDPSCLSAGPRQVAPWLGNQRSLSSPAFYPVPASAKDRLSLLPLFLRTFFFSPFPCLKLRELLSESKQLAPECSAAHLPAHLGGVKVLPISL